MTTLPTAPLSEADYYALEDALLSTEKGRRFLYSYVERNRGVETLRLLRSISRMHRAALGLPGVNAEVCRDLAEVLKAVSRNRERSVLCSNDAARCESLLGGMEEIEACVITLIESIEERMAGPLQEDLPTLAMQVHGDSYSSDRTAKLFGELSSYFSAEQR